jgi:predicted ATP-grasp superfamily ATP-dependent carboligase
MNPTNDRIRILLSEGSSNSARQTLYGLGDKYTIDLVDPSPWCQCRFSSLVRRRIPCPQIAKDPVGYVRFVAKLVQQHRYDVFFPTHEQVYVFAKFRDAFQRHVGLAVPAFEAIRRVQSKAEFAILMEELGLPTPATKIVLTKSELSAHSDFPCFVKLVHSTASLGVQRVSDSVELSETVHRFEQAGAWTEGQEIVIQQPARGRQSEVNAVFQNGRLVGIACADVLQTGIGGGPTLRRSALHPAVIQQMERLGSYLNWHGPISLEYFYDCDTQQPVYIEANPRIGETLNSQISGVNLCEATVRIALGEHVDRIPEAKPGVMSHNGFIVMIADAYNGANRRQLSKRLINHWARQGDFGSCDSDMTRLGEDKLSLIPATAVILRLLVSPRSARGLAQSTVDNYSLPTTAAAVIDELSDQALNDLLAHPIEGKHVRTTKP